MKVGTDLTKNTSWIDVHGERLNFTIRERTRKTPADWTTWDRRKGPFEYWDHELLGELVLEINSSCRESFRRSWTDGKKQRIEGCLNAFLIGLYKVADARRYHRNRDNEEMRIPGHSVLPVGHLFSSSQSKRNDPRTAPAGGVMFLKTGGVMFLKNTPSAGVMTLKIRWGHVSEIPPSKWGHVSEK